MQGVKKIAEGIEVANIDQKLALIVQEKRYFLTLKEATRLIEALAGVMSNL